MFMEPIEVANTEVDQPITFKIIVLMLYSISLCEQMAIAHKDDVVGPHDGCVAVSNALRRINESVDKSVLWVV